MPGGATTGPVSYPGQGGGGGGGGAGVVVVLFGSGYPLKVP